MLATAPPPSLFDYGALEPESRIVVQQKTGEIRDRVQRAAEDIRAIGERLLIVKGHLEYGAFGDWLRIEFDWSVRSAQNLMAVADKFRNANFAEVAIAPSALYLLASDAFTDEDRTEAVDAARAGEKITHAAVKAKADTKKAKAPKKTPARHVVANARDVPADDDAQTAPDDKPTPADGECDTSPEPAAPAEPDIDSIEAAQLRRLAADASDELLAKGQKKVTDSHKAVRKTLDRLSKLLANSSPSLPDLRQAFDALRTSVELLLDSPLTGN